jgi:hypothetical protein
MKRTLTVSSALVLAALSLAASPATAQERRGSGERRGDGGRQAHERAVPRSSDRPAQGPDARQGDRGGYAPRETYRPQEQRRDYSPRDTYRSQGRREYSPRGDYRPAPRDDYRSGGRYAVPRGNYGGYSGHADRGYYARPYTRPYVRPYSYSAYRPYYFSRPYYSFRPRFSIGFGLWLGNPVPYPYSYLGSYRPRVYGYYPRGSYEVSVYGGVSFDIQPSDAELYVDEEYVGTIGMFTPNGEPLTLTPGVHRISVQRDGFRSMEWDVTIEPGQVIPYRGDMERY